MCANVVYSARLIVTTANTMTTIRRWIARLLFESVISTLGCLDIPLACHKHEIICVFQQCRWSCVDAGWD